MTVGRDGELEPLVREALNMLFTHDGGLIENENSEWAVAHRLAVYLEKLLPGWNIDCEFNRQGDGADPKARDGGAKVRPDISIHHRGQLAREHNLLVIELKKEGGSGDDQTKAKEYTSPPNSDRRFQYLYGLTIVLGSPCKLSWFRDGKQDG